MIFSVVHALLWAAALGAVLGSAWTDLRDRIIPNELVGLVAACGLGLTLVLRPEQAWIGVLAAIALIVLLGVAAHFGMIGGGDVKLIAAASLLFPPDQIGQLLVFIAVAGGLLGCGYLLARYTLRRGRLQRTPSTGAAAGAGASVVERRGWFSMECSRIAAGGPMPYALAILGGVAGTIAGELPQCLHAGYCSL
jgi:prepilin peptidase CpaA